MDSVNYTALENAHLSELQENLTAKLEALKKDDFGARSDGLKSSVMTMVVNEAYDRAKEELSFYVDSKTDFPNFQDRAIRYVQHCCELIQAIQTKRNFPGLGTLSMAKQQEIHERVLAHFHELKGNLIHIEKLEREQKLNDLRATVWVLRALVVAVAGVTTTAFLMEVNQTVLTSFMSIIQSIANELTDWFFNFF